MRATLLALIAFAATLAHPLDAATLSPGDLVVGDSRSPPRISVVNPQTKVKTLICSCTTLGTVLGVAVRGSEKIYAIGQLAGSATEAVVAIDPATGAQTVVSSGGSFKRLQGIALEADGSILVSDHSIAVSPLAGKVIRVNPATGQQTVVTSGNRLKQAWGLAVAPSGQIYVAATTDIIVANNFVSGVVRIDPASGQQTVVAYGDDFGLTINSVEIYGAADIAIDQAGDIFVLDKRFRGNNLEDETRLIKVNPATGAQTMLNNSLKGVDRTKTGFDFRGIAILNGVLYASDYRLSQSGLPGISKVDAAGGGRVDVTSEDFLGPTGLAVVPVGTPATSILLSLTSGWNLAGNGSSGVLDVATAFGDASKVSTVWKWSASSARWAFYSPSLVGPALTDYAASKGYDVLASVNGGEGYWVNAKAPFTVQMPAGSAIASSSFQGMASGWSLIAIGETRTPSQFNALVGATTPLTTLWAWDATLSNWYFYAPSLEASGGLGSYITSKGYLDFTTNGKTLGAGGGFWVNKP